MAVTVRQHFDVLRRDNSPSGTGEAIEGIRSALQDLEAEDSLSNGIDFVDIQENWGEDELMGDLVVVWRATARAGISETTNLLIKRYAEGEIRRHF